MSKRHLRRLFAFVVAGVAAACTGASAPPGHSVGAGPSDKPVGSDCDPAACGPAPGMPVQQCPDGSVGGNTGRCIVQAGGQCGWEIRDCPAASGGDTSACIRTGCSGTVCAAPGEEVFTTCELRPEYACYADAKCEKQSNGACGFTQTPERTGCLATPPKDGARAK